MKTRTWRSADALSRTRARPSTRAGSIDWTGSSMTMKRNGLSGRVARGTKRLRASECSSPWLITPRAAPATPSTVTSRTTRRRVPSPVSWIRPSSTWLCWRRRSQISPAFSAMGPKRSSRMPAAAFLSQLSAGLIRTEVRGPVHRVARAQEPGRDLLGHGPPRVFLAGPARRALSPAGARPPPGAARSPSPGGGRARRGPRSIPPRSRSRALPPARRGPAPPRSPAGARRASGRPGLPIGGGPLPPARARPPPPAPTPGVARRRPSLLVQALLSAPLRSQTGQSASPWAAWKARACSSSFAASRERAAAVPLRGGERPFRPPRISATAAATRAGIGRLEARDRPKHVGFRGACLPATRLPPGPRPGRFEVPLLLFEVAAATRRARSSSTPRSRSSSGPRASVASLSAFSRRAARLLEHGLGPTRSSRPRIAESAS